MKINDFNIPLINEINNMILLFYCFITYNLISIPGYPRVPNIPLNISILIWSESLQVIQDCIDIFN